MNNPRVQTGRGGRGPTSAARSRAQTAAAAPEGLQANGLLTGVSSMSIVGTNGRKEPAGAPAAAPPESSRRQLHGSSTEQQHSARSARQTGQRSLSQDGGFGDGQQTRGSGSSLGGSVTGSTGLESSRSHGPRAHHALIADDGVQHASIMDFNTAFCACVKVFCASVAPCYALPWVRGEESHTTGSGFAVVLPNGDRRLLTHAAILENHCLVQVRRMRRGPQRARGVMLSAASLLAC